MFRTNLIAITLIITSILILKSKSTPICGPVCEIYCIYGNVLDDKGCPTCKCKQSPCQNQALPLAGYFCGGGPNRKDCPSTHKCVTAPNDAYAVCCPRFRIAVTTRSLPIVKPGQCPQPQKNVFGPCFAACTHDGDCLGNLKCCGSCPRTCVQPIC